MKSKDKKLDFTGQAIFAGLDVHKRSWKSTFCTHHTVQKTISFEKPLVESLVDYLNRTYPNGDYYCAYEAGFCGFWPQEQLQRLGIKTIVVNPADIPTTDKERQFKNDKRDSRKIAISLRSGELKGIYVPGKEAQKHRSLVRERASIAKSQSRVKNQIKSHLHFYGIEIPEDFARRYWSGNFVKWLEQIAKQNSDKALAFKIKRHLLLRQLQLETTRQLRALSKTAKYQELYKLLYSVPGLGLLTTMLLITEIVEMKRFKKEDHMLSYAGFIPTSADTGDKQKTGPMTKRGNPRIKWALVESAWVAIRQDSELLLRYENFRKTKGAQKAIVKIARILLRKIRRVWLKQEKYIYAEV